MLELMSHMTIDGSLLRMIHHEACFSVKKGSVNMVLYLSFVCVSFYGPAG